MSLIGRIVFGKNTQRPNILFRELINRSKTAKNKAEEIARRKADRWDTHCAKWRRRKLAAAGLVAVGGFGLSQLDSPQEDTSPSSPRPAPITRQASEQEIEAMHTRSLKRQGFKANRSIPLETEPQRQTLSKSIPDPLPDPEKTKSD